MLCALKARLFFSNKSFKSFIEKNTSALYFKRAYFFFILNTFIIGIDILSGQIIKTKQEVAFSIFWRIYVVKVYYYHKHNFFGKRYCSSYFSDDMKMHVRYLTLYICYDSECNDSGENARFITLEQVGTN